MEPRGVPRGPQGAMSLDLEGWRTSDLKGRRHGTPRGDTMGPFTVLQLCKAQLSIINQRKTVNGPMAPHLEV